MFDKILDYCFQQIINEFQADSSLLTIENYQRNPNHAEKQHLSEIERVLDDVMNR